MADVFSTLGGIEATWPQAIGILGFVIYVGGFLLVQARLMCGNGLWFPASKVVAALCVICSLSEAFNLATLLVQISFIAIGLGGVARRI